MLLEPRDQLLAFNAPFAADPVSGDGTGLQLSLDDLRVETKQLRDFRRRVEREVRHAQYASISERIMTYSFDAI